MTGETRWASDDSDKSPFRTEVKENSEIKSTEKSSKRRYRNYDYDSDLDQEFYNANDFGDK